MPAGARPAARLARASATSPPPQPATAGRNAAHAHHNGLHENIGRLLREVLRQHQGLLEVGVQHCTGRGPPVRRSPGTAAPRRVQSVAPGHACQRAAGAHAPPASSLARTCMRQGVRCKAPHVGCPKQRVLGARRLESSGAQHGAEVGPAGRRAARKPRPQPAPDVEYEKQQHPLPQHVEQRVQHQREEGEGTSLPVCRVVCRPGPGRRQWVPLELARPAAQRRSR